MLGIKLIVSALLVTGVSSSFADLFSGLFSKCNPPESLIGKLCAPLLDVNVDKNEIINMEDVNVDLLRHNVDNDLCTIKESEYVEHYTCRYGMTKDFARFMFGRIDRHKDGVIDEQDFPADPTRTNVTTEAFTRRQYIRFRDDWCGVAENIKNPMDVEYCKQIAQLKPEDVVCKIRY